MVDVIGVELVRTYIKALSSNTVDVITNRAFVHADSLMMEFLGRGCCNGAVVDAVFVVDEHALLVAGLFGDARVESVISVEVYRTLV